jgi:hypothetical protein
MTENIALSPVPDLSDLVLSASWTVRYRDPSGFDCQLTLESGSGTEVLQKAQAALTRLSESGCTPIRQNLHGSATTNDSSTSGKAREAKVICPIHNVPMKEWKKNGRSWFSHKLEDGSWCKGGKS